MKKISFEIPDRDERGVSPVIGVILMVAITVILAAVIASFVLGFGDSVQSNVQAGASISVDESNSSASVTWVSEGSATELTVNHNGAEVGGSPLTNVGDKTSNFAVSDGDTITVVATDGDSTTVVSEKTI